MTQKWSKCPFCGEAGKQSKEHVWSKWLRNSPVVQDLLRDARGERFLFEYSDLERVEGQLKEVWRSANVASWVPQITAAVCATCNNGWMSRLETQIKRLVAPTVLEGAPAIIHAGGVLTIARWAVKTAMTYQLALGMRDGGIFTPHEMRRMAKRQEIPSRCRVWMRSVTGPRQFVATKYQGLFLVDGQEVAQLSLRDNLGLMLVALPGIVLVVGVAPTAETAWMIECLVPIEFGTSRAPQIWPEPGRIELPTFRADENEFDPLAVFNGLEMMSQVGHPLQTDLAPEELAELLRMQRAPDQRLQELIDAFTSDCESEKPDPELSDLLMVLNGVNLDPNQLEQLYDAAGVMIEKHVETWPQLVCRRLYNLGNLFFVAKDYCTCLVLMIACVGRPDGGYEERPDAWERTGHAAWRIAAYGLAKEAYAMQLALDPTAMECRFNLAETTFHAGDFANSADILKELSPQGQSETLRDTLACFEVTLALVLDELELSHLEGFGGPGPQELLEILAGSKVLGFDADHRFAKELVERLGGLTDVDVGGLTVAKAYLTDELADWVTAAVTLLDSQPSHPALLPVLRKGNSRGKEFAKSLDAELAKRGSGRLLPDGREAASYVASHAYTKRPRTVRLVDSANQIVETF